MNTAQTVYLDALRGFAAQLVLIGHIYSIVLRPGETLGIGDLGVVIFFILSGFLICYTSIKKQDQGNYSFNGYLTDRFFRIFVPYIPAVIFIVILDSYTYNYTSSIEYVEHYNFKDLIATLTMLQQHPIGLFFDKLLGIEEFKLATFGSSRPLWTVAIEWWLYVVFGFVLFYKRFSKHWLLALLLFMVFGIVPFFNTVAGTGQGLSLVWFVMACLAYGYYKNGNQIQDTFSQYVYSSIRSKILFVIFIGMLFFLMLVRFFWVSYIEPGFVFERPVFYDFNLYMLLMITLVIIFIALGASQINGRNRFIQLLADYSYSLYLIHYTFIFFLSAIGFNMGGDLSNLVVFYIICNLVAILFWWLFERNHRKLKQLYKKKFAM